MTTEWANLTDLSHFPSVDEDRIRQIEQKLEELEKKVDLVVEQKLISSEKRLDFVVECIGHLLNSVSVFPIELRGQG
jgi:hypothetical protein